MKIKHDDLVYITFQDPSVANAPALAIGSPDSSTYAQYGPANNAMPHKISAIAGAILQSGQGFTLQVKSADLKSFLYVGHDPLIYYWYEDASQGNGKKDNNHWIIKNNVPDLYYGRPYKLSNVGYPDQFLSIVPLDSKQRAYLTTSATQSMDIYFWPVVENMYGCGMDPKKGNDTCIPVPPTQVLTSLPMQCNANTIVKNPDPNVDTFDPWDCIGQNSTNKKINLFFLTEQCAAVSTCKGKGTNVPDVEPPPDPAIAKRAAALAKRNNIIRIIAGVLIGILVVIILVKALSKKSPE